MAAVGDCFRAQQHYSATMSYIRNRRCLSSERKPTVPRHLDPNRRWRALQDREEAGCLPERSWPGSLR
jgi:hypothetical protein